MLRRAFMLVKSGPKYTEHSSDSPSSGTNLHAEPPGSHPHEPDHAAVARELELILASPFFHASKRSQQFLKYVVQYRLDGNEESLKERAIGAVLYNRPVNYATGDDSVVRVQAGEVRRRLEQYYQEPPSGSHVHIGLPLGSYAPEFRWVPAATPDHAAVQEPVALETDTLPGQNSSSVQRMRKRYLWLTSLGCTIVLVAALVGLWVHHKFAPGTILDQFWSPVFATPKPVLICLPEPVFYRPSAELFMRREQTPGEFDKEIDRMTGRPHLQPDDQIQWKDMVEFKDFGVSKGDIKAAFRLSNLLIETGKDTEIRVGDDYGWDDLRNAPAVIIGAFSNRWTFKITSGLHFAFAEDKGVALIQEQGPSGRAWFAELDPRTGRVASDYGLVTRLVNSGTGQFVVDVAGLTAAGSEAAAEVAANEEDLEKALRRAPRDWKRKNVQIVVKTTVVDEIAGPAQVVAVYLW
jgi:hypothetical protein